MSCSCGDMCSSCAYFVRSTAIAVSGTAVKIAIPTTALNNQQRLCIALTQAIPGTATANMTVQIVDGGTTLNVVTPCGNYLYADQLRSRRVLHTNVLTDTLTAKLTNLCGLVPTAHTFATIPASVAATASDNASTTSDSTETNAPTTVKAATTSTAKGV